MSRSRCRDIRRPARRSSSTGMSTWPARRCGGDSISQGRQLFHRGRGPSAPGSDRRCLVAGCSTRAGRRARFAHAGSIPRVCASGSTWPSSAKRVHRLGLGVLVVPDRRRTNLPSSGRCRIKPKEGAYKPGTVQKSILKRVAGVNGRPGRVEISDGHGAPARGITNLRWRSTLGSADNPHRRKPRAMMASRA